jgi:hypothetical protein
MPLWPGCRWNTGEKLVSLTQQFARRFANYSDRNSVGFKLRMKRIQPLLDLIEQVFAESGSVHIVDIGGTETYWKIVPAEFLDRHRVHITLVNLPGSGGHSTDSRFTVLEADGCELSAFTDKQFHIAHSNSVIEHVGDWRRMVQFAAEFKRVAHRYFIQTPNFWFPIEPHCMTPFIHWLPKPLRIKLVRRFHLGHWGRARSVSEAVEKIESARLLDGSMFTELFRDARIHRERFFLLPKSWVAVKA